jgi:hypothetical protein
VHKLDLPATTPIQPRRLTSPRTGRITPKNSEVDRGDALAFRRDHIAVLVSVTSTTSICTQGFSQRRAPKRPLPFCCHTALSVYH